MKTAQRVGLIGAERAIAALTTCLMTVRHKRLTGTVAMTRAYSWLLADYYNTT